MERLLELAARSGGPPVLIGFDARKLRDGGIGTYVRNVLAAMMRRPREHTFAVFVDPAHFGVTTWPGAATRELAVRAGKYSILEHWALPRAARSVSAELFHAPHYTLPLLWSGPAVVTIHDLIHVRHPRFFRPGTALYARAMAGAAARHADLVIANSHHTCAEVVDLLHVPVERVRVVPLAVAPGIARRNPDAVAVFRAARALPQDYVLYMGARKRHKQVDLLLRAIATIPPAARPPLVLSGPRWRADSGFARLTDDLGLVRHVFFAGDFSTDSEVACCYSGAALYVQPSLTEGFGLPPLEAMACGVPVLCSSGGALAETAGDAAEMLPPENPERWGWSIRALLGDAARRAELERRGLIHARRVSWDDVGSATLDVYEAARERFNARSRRETPALPSAPGS